MLIGIDPLKLTILSMALTAASLPLAAGPDFEIREFLLGPYALLERITTWITGGRMLKFLSGGTFGKTYRIPWDKMDLDDPNHPRLLLTKNQLVPEHK